LLPSYREWSPLDARERPNGGTHAKTVLLAAAVTAALSVGVGAAGASTAINPGEGWHSFSYVAGPDPITTAQAPFTFTTTGNVTLAITDVLCPGEIYSVYDNGVLIGTTSQPQLSTCSYAGSTANPDEAMLDPTYSSGWATLGPGPHSINIVVVQTAGYPVGGGYVRIDATTGGGNGNGLAAKAIGYRYPAAKKFH
jgi:hypothetical protein